jgi:hypothetical protein
MLIDEETFELNNYGTELKDNENLLTLCFGFCDINDILNISAASKKFHKLTSNMDYIFEEAIEKNYFSNYANYE